MTDGRSVCQTVRQTESIMAKTALCIASYADALSKREGKERYIKSQVGYISPIWGADPLEPISTKIGRFVGVHDLINHSKFGFNIFRGFRSTGGQNFRFPIDFAGHRYNSAAATAQPVVITNHYMVSHRVTISWYPPLYGALFRFPGGF